MKYSPTDHPWFACSAPGRNPRHRVHILTHDKIIAHLYLESEEDRANLQLIKAAPKLLEAVERMLPYLRIMAENNDGARRAAEEASKALRLAHGIHAGDEMDPPVSRKRAAARTQD